MSRSRASSDASIVSADCFYPPDHGSEGGAGFASTPVKLNLLPPRREGAASATPPDPPVKPPQKKPSGGKPRGGRFQTLVLALLGGLVCLMVACRTSAPGTRLRLPLGSTLPTPEPKVPHVPTGIPETAPRLRPRRSGFRLRGDVRAVPPPLPHLENE